MNPNGWSLDDAKMEGPWHPEPYNAMPGCPEQGEDLWGDDHQTIKPSVCIMLILLLVHFVMKRNIAECLICYIYVCFCYRRHQWPGGIRYFCMRWHMGRVGWVGWGWWRFFHLHTCDMLWTWRFLHLHTCDMLRKSWGGLGGWGGDDDVSFTCTHVTCYALDVSFTCTHVTSYGLDVSCTCTHVTCYASHGEGWVGGVGMMTFLALAHMWHATQVMGRVGWVGWGWWRFFHLHTCDMLRTWRFLHLHTCDMLRTWRFLHLHTCDMLRKSWGGLGGWGGDDDVSFTCTHVTCYALDVSCTCTHVTCYASQREGWVGGVGMMTFRSLAHMWHARHLTFLALAHVWHAMDLEIRV